jgi:threonine/homoserine/homoserine lactone efflux protein
VIPLDRFLAFLGAAVVVTFAPGPDIFYVLTRGMTQGRRVALAAAAGFALGNFVHTALAAAGLSALVAASPPLYAAIKYAGAAYLVYMGVGMWLSARRLAKVEGAAPVPAGQAFRQSIVANVLNPKVAVFFLSFLPQFVDAERGSTAVQFAILGTTFAAQALACFSVVAIASGWIGDRLLRSKGAGKWLGRAAGTMLVTLGAVVALQG